MSVRLSCRLLRRWLAAALLLVVSIGVLAQEPPPVREPPVPLLWKVTSSAVEDVASAYAAGSAVYLLGAFHLLRADDWPLSVDVEDVFAQAGHVAFEIAPQEMDVETGKQVLEMGVRTDGTLLESGLSPETAKQLQRWQADNAKWMERLRIESQWMQHMHPWLVATQIALVELHKAGLDPAFGLDVQLMERAQQAGKTTSGLETLGGQIQFLAGMDRDEQVEFLRQALEQAAAGREQIDRLHALWRAGDADGLWRELEPDFRAQFPKLYQRINVARNVAWRAQVETWLQQPPPQTVLMVVGAMHLVGEDGLVEMLRARGYVVERVCSACGGD